MAPLLNMGGKELPGICLTKASELREASHMRHRMAPDPGANTRKCPYSLKNYDADRGTTTVEEKEVSSRTKGGEKRHASPPLVIEAHAVRRAERKEIESQPPCDHDSPINTATVSLKRAT